MKTFRDNSGRTWVVEVHVAAVKACRGRLGVDLLGLVDGGFEGLAGLLDDPVGLVDVLFVVSRQADEKAPAVSDEDFGRAMAGDVIADAARAFLDEFTDFFPDPRVRAGLKKVAAKAGEVTDRMIGLAGEGLEALDRIDPGDVARSLIASSGGSPAPSGSTPGPSPSAS